MSAGKRKSRKLIGRKVRRMRNKSYVKSDSIRDCRRLHGCGLVK